MQNALLGFLVSFSVSLLIAPFIISFFNKIKNGQPILGYVESHYKKSGTPTMGGVIFIAGTVVAFLLTMGENVRLSVIAIAAMLGYGLLGFLDDFIKVKYKNNQGLKAYQKVIGQLGIATLIGLFAFNSPLIGGELVLPFTNNLTINIGAFIIPIVIFVLIATTNAVNLTDGLDGLASSVTFVYLIGFSSSLFMYIQQLQQAGASTIQINELTSLFSISIILAGAILAFICFNSHPAKIFMGDAGSLAIGGFISVVAVFSKMTLFLPFYGFMFVASTISVIIQVLYYKATKKRVFLMAPLHHHFEKKGFSETKIVTGYTVITILIIIFMQILSY